jgi:beta-lactamase class A
MALNSKKILKIIFIGALLICGSYFAYRYSVNLQQAHRRQIALAQKKTAWQKLKQDLSAQVRRFKGQPGIVIKDLQRNWEISYNKDLALPSASLAKIPIMAACFLASEQGRLVLSRQVILSNSDKLSGSGILKDVRPGTVFTVEELIGLMIYDSDNTATNILTNLVGIDYLNQTFNAWGFKDTNLSRRVADFSLRDRGIENYTTAQDIAWLLERIYRKELISREVSEKCLRVLKLQRVNDRIPKYLPAYIAVAHKTGLERNVCHDAGIIFGCKGDLLICVLTKHTNPNAAIAKNFIAQVALRAYIYLEQ